MRTNCDAAQLYHIHSSYLRDRRDDDLIAPPSNDDQRPFRFRTYPGSQRVDLPGRDFRFNVRLGTILRQRRSVRDFRLRPLDLLRVGRLLHASYGAYGYQQHEEASFYRPCPSAGALYPLELYIASQAVTGLPDGLYHYDARAHQLELRCPRRVHREMAELLIREDFREIVLNANLVIIIAAIFERTMRTYGERGYRYVWLEAGHVGQNLYLAATALGLGPVSLDGFLDDELNRLLNLPADEEDAIYLLCIGHSGRSRGRR